MFDCCRCLLKSLDKYQMSQQFVLIKIYPSFERYHKGILSTERIRTKNDESSYIIA